MNGRHQNVKRKRGPVAEGGPVALAGDRQDGRSVFSLVKKDGRLVSRLQFNLGGAWRTLSRGRLTFLTAAAAAIHEGLTQSLEQRNKMFTAFVTPTYSVASDRLHFQSFCN